MVVFYLDGTFNYNQDKLYNKRDLRDKSQICTITSQIETICYKNEGKFRTCECLSRALLSQEHDERMPKLLWIPSTTNCTRAADIQTIQLQPLSLQISVLGWTIGTASLEFPLFSFLWSTIPDIFFKFSSFHCVSSVTHYMLMKLCSHVDHDPNKRYLLPSRAYEEEITSGREQ